MDTNTRTMKFWVYRQSVGNSLQIGNSTPLKTPGLQLQIFLETEPLFVRTCPPTRIMQRVTQGKQQAYPVNQL
jgi:hypothetical protein